MRCGDCQLWVKDENICGNPESPHCADIRMYYERCGKWKGKWELNEWGEPRERNLAIYIDREKGMIFKDIGKKYGISTDRARTIWYREKKRAEWRLKHTGTEDITTIEP